MRSPTSNASPLRYLALGDSYTIGTGATDDSHNYPSLLAGKLRQATGREVEVTNPAVNGFTTLDLIRNELPLVRRVKPRLVTLLIGVNDLVQGRSPEQYRDAMVRIHDAIATLKLGPGCGVAVSIPNWSVVPAAGDFGDRAKLRRLTEAFNAIAEDEARRRGFDWVDITAVSTSGEGRAGWIADDRLHPGDVQYAAWAEVIWERVKVSWSASAL